MECLRNREMKIFSSKLFVVISTAVTAALGGVAGWLLAYQPSVNGAAYGQIINGYGGVSGLVETKYVFSAKIAVGYWLLALAITFLVLLVAVLIRKIYLREAIEKQAEAEENGDLN